VRVEVSPNDRAAENRRRPSGARLGDESFQVPPVARVGVRVAARVILLLIVVAELHEDIVVHSELTENGLPAPLVDEALRAAAVYGEVADRHAVIEERGQQLAPATLGVLLGLGLIGHRRVAHQEDGGFPRFLCDEESHRDKKGWIPLHPD